MNVTVNVTDATPEEVAYLLHNIKHYSEKEARIAEAEKEEPAAPAKPAAKAAAPAKTPAAKKPAPAPVEEEEEEPAPVKKAAAPTPAPKKKFSIESIHGQIDVLTEADRDDEVRAVLKDFGYKNASKIEAEDFIPIATALQELIDGE